MNLVIHPEDPSTVFLKPIYEGVGEKTVLEIDTNPESLNELIKKSDRVIAMGHGSPHGLFSINLFSKPDSWACFAINDDHANTLRCQGQNVYIWCHANRFVDFNDLHGFYSGMFISEVSEALFCGLKKITQQMVDESNNLFSAAVGEHINSPKEKLYEKVREIYGKLAKSNPVALYNLERLCVR